MIAANRPVSVAMAEQVAEVFTEVIVAPAYEDGAVEVLQGKKNIRILVCPDTTAGAPVETAADLAAALLVQHGRPRRRRRRRPVDLDARRPARPPRRSVLADLAFAWRPAAR